VVDQISAERRSAVMAKIKSKNTSPEIRVRKAAHAMGLRFRLNRRDLPGNPDLVFPKLPRLLLAPAPWVPSCIKAKVKNGLLGGKTPTQH